MKRTNWSFAVLCVLLAVLVFLSARTLNARDANLASGTLVAAHTAKQQCINNCRARYHDCLHLKQLPQFECRDIYQDCTRYSCTGLGPG
jgi:hypothetical protein